MVLYKRGADAQSFLMRTGGNQANGTYTIVHQFAGQLSACHAWITDGKVEAIGNGLIAILVIDYIEAVLAEDLLQFLGTFAINLYIVAETVFAVAGSTEHLG